MKNSQDNAPGQAELWDLLEKSPPQKASPAFTQNVVRAARLSEAGKRSNTPWQALTTTLSSVPKLALIGLPLILLGLVLTTTLSPRPSSSQGSSSSLSALNSPDTSERESTVTSITAVQPSEQMKQVVGTPTTTEADDWLADALLETALEQPDLFSDAELVAMLF